jgi:hypothetical protein
VALLLLAYLFPLLLVPPAGDFPLLDAWVYALSVRHLADEGRLVIHDWTATTLVAQVAWGALFAKLFGFSFTVLRCSTLALSFAGSLALYALCRALDLSRPRALAGALVYWFNPLTFGLSYTFMSDVPAASLLLLTTLGYAQGVRRASDRALFLGSCGAALAFLVRHPGLLLPPAVLAYGLLAGWPPRLLARRALLTGAAPALAVAAYAAWAQRHGLPQEHGAVAAAILRRGPALWRPALVLTGYILVYLGLFALPLALAATPGAARAVAGWGRGRRAALLAWAGAVAGLVACLAWRGTTQPQHARWMPYLKYGAMIHRDGLGPDGLLGARPPLLPLGGRVALTVLAAGGLVFLGAALARRLPRAPRRPAPGAAPVALVALVALLQFAAIFPVSAHVLVNHWLSFDRYLLPLLPLVLALALWATRGLRLSPALLLLGLLPLALFALAGTHDWLAHNRLRWQLGRELVARGVPLERIDAGMEWDGWFLYEASRRQRLPPRTPGGPFWTQVIATATDSTYVVAFAPLPGYAALERREYPAWLRAEPAYLYVLQRR